MGEMLPLFPLGAVLYPGHAAAAAHLEERYGQLRPATCSTGRSRAGFGVIAIRKGRETGIDGVRSLFRLAASPVRGVKRREDGRLNIVTVGTQRFRLLGLDQTRPYLQGEVELLSAGRPGGSRGRRCAGR